MAEAIATQSLLRLWRKIGASELPHFGQSEGIEPARRLDHEIRTTIALHNRQAKAVWRCCRLQAVHQHHLQRRPCTLIDQLALIRGWVEMQADRMQGREGKVDGTARFGREHIARASGFQNGRRYPRITDCP